MPEAGLSPTAKLNREVVVWDLKTSIVGPERFDINNPQSPYVISQQDGAYFSIPDFARFRAHDRQCRRRRGLSVAPVAVRDGARQGDSRADQAAGGARLPRAGLVARPRARPDAAGCARRRRRTAPWRTRSPSARRRRRSLASWRARAAKIVADARLSRSRPPDRGRDRAAPDDARRRRHLARSGRRRDLRRRAWREATTTNFTPDEVHQIGLQQVAEISAELDKILRSAGFTSGSVGERLTALNKSPAQLYPNTDAGRAELIASLNEGVKAMYAKLPQAFATLPKQPLEIRRVPPEIQDGASNGYYRPATLDGSRPAIYFINLKARATGRNIRCRRSPTMRASRAITCRSASRRSRGTFRCSAGSAFYSAYGEGWALYSEQFADELGGYKGIERAGYLQSFLFRAERLVVDTGLNAKRWTREKAIDHMVAATGFARPRVQREIERYCASPGQACSYKIGHIAWSGTGRRRRQRSGRSSTCAISTKS